MYLRWAHATHHILVKGRGVLALRKYFFVKDLSPHLRDSIFGEEREWFSRCVRRDSVPFESNLLHSVYGLWRLEVHVLGRIKGLFFRDLCAIDQGLRQFVGRSRSLLGSRTNDYWRFHVFEDC